MTEGSANGYGLMKQIEEKTDGVWRPSPGSMYPALAQLSDEGLIETADTSTGKPEFRLTDSGRAYIEKHRDHVESVWEPARSKYDEFGPLMEASHTLMAAVRQIAQVGTAEQRQLSTEKLVELRRELYKLLAE